MPSRKLRWVLPVIVVGLVVLIGLFVRARRPKEEAKALSQEIPFVGEVQNLVPREPVQRDLQGGQGHAYQLTLDPGAYVEIEADQQGIDVALRLLAPDGTLRAEVDSPNGNRGPEIAYEVAESGGSYRLEVISEDPQTAKGRYALTVSVPRPATVQDRKHLEAWRLFRQGEGRRGDGDFSSARESYQQALDLWRDLEKPDWEAESLFRIGWMDMALGSNEEALASLEQALPVLRRLDKRFETALVLNRISSSHFLLGQLDAALAAGEEAAELARQAGRPEVEAGALRNIGNVYKVRGERERAIEIYRSALAHARAAQDADDEGGALYEIGDLLTIQGKHQAASDALKQAVQALGRAASFRDMGRALRKLANAEQRLDQRDSAAARLRQAVTLARQTSDHDGEAAALSSLGTLYLLGKETDKAGDLYRQALEIYQQEKNGRGEATALLNLGRYERQAGQLPAALASYDRAIALFHVLGDPVGEASALFGSAQVLHDRRDFPEADARLQRVVANVERLRSDSASQDLRASFFATKQHYFDLHIDVLMHLHEADRSAGYDHRALELNEKRRARSFLERLTESRAGLYRTTDAALADRQRALQKSLNATAEQLIEQEEQNEKQRELLVAKQGELLDQLDALQTEIKKQSPWYVALTQPEPLSVPEMQKQVLERQTLLLIFSLGEERSFLWLVPPEGQIESHVLPARAYLEPAARQVQAGWSRRAPNPSRADADRWAERLSHELLEPVAGQIGGKRLLIVTDGALQYLPFGALPDPRTLPGGSHAGKIQPLVAGNEVIHLPSASVLAALRREPGKNGAAPLWAAIFADPVFTPDDPRLEKADPASPAPENRPSSGEPELQRSVQDLGLSGLKRIPHTADEVEILRELIGSKNPRQLFTAVGPKASLSTLRSTPLKAYKILHFATHGLLNPEHPELSGLVLSRFDEKGRPQDGFLLAHEICNLDLQADLVVLSACQTGVGPEVKGEGLVGLTRSFMYAGAPRVLVSLWNISDRATPELMRRFYKAMIQYGSPPAKALRCAQLSMSRDPNLNDPYLWAPFIFQGEWRDKLRAPGEPIEKVSTGAVTTNIPDIDLPGGGHQGSGGCPDLS